MYRCANGGYHVDIERINSNIPGGFVAEARERAEIMAIQTIISALSVDISANLTHALWHEGKER
jgi:hypothetical protein